MPTFGTRSLERLGTCHPDLRAVFVQAIMDVDITIVCGERSRNRQKHLFEIGASKVLWPDSLHNSHLSAGTSRALSAAVDFAPWVNGGIPWKDAELFTNIAFYLRGTGRGLGIDLRLGADWDGDFLCRDQTFHDLGHVELIDE